MQGLTDIMATKVERPKPVPDVKDSEPADMEVEVPGEEDDDLYTRLKTLQRQLEFFEIQARLALSSQGCCASPPLLCALLCA